MRILFDNGTPAPLRRELPEHEVDLAERRGWAAVRNGNLLELAEENGYDAFISTDDDFLDPELHTDRIIVIVIHGFNWPISPGGIAGIREALNQTAPGAPIFLDLRALR